MTTIYGQRRETSGIWGNTLATSRTFKIGQSVIYPTHGVGKIINFEQREIVGQKLDLIVIAFDRNMTFQIPKEKAEKHGLRPVSDEATVKRAFETMRDSPRTQQGIWARRVKDLDQKVNSGDLILLSRLLRDLAPRGRNERGFSYSERNFFETAMKRVSEEIAIIRKKTPEAVKAEIEKALAEQKPPVVVRPAAVNG